MNLVNSIGTRAANDAGFRALMVRVTHPFHRFSGTPLSDAEAIMGECMHTIADVCMVLGHDADFRAQNSHLMLVPYTVAELEWAVRHDVVLTLYTRAIQSIVRCARGAVDVPSEITNGCDEEVRRAPHRAEWRLMLRSSIVWREEDILRLQPKSLRKRVFVPELGLVLSAAVLDSKIHRHMPKGIRLTASTLKKEDGTVHRRILVTGGFASGSAVRVVTAHGHAEYLPAIGWKPCRITV